MCEDSIKWVGCTKEGMEIGVLKGSPLDQPTPPSSTPAVSTPRKRTRNGELMTEGQRRRRIDALTHHYATNEGSSPFLRGELLLAWSQDIGPLSAPVPPNSKQNARISCIPLEGDMD